MTDASPHPNLVITDVRSHAVESTNDGVSYRKAVTCVICFKLFTSMDKYEIHMNNSHASPDASLDAQSSPHGPNMIPCIQCEESFNTIYELETHNLQEHPNNWVIECQSCHEKTDIPDDGQLTVCPFCDEPYSNAPYANGATLDHLTGSFECPRCNHCFFSKITLRDHQIADHPESYTAYLCRHKGCNQKFNTFDEYIQHLEEHKLKYTCDFCDKSFSKQQTLRLHLRAHTGEKPYVCEECGRAFAVKDYLTKHKRIHTGEKPYECELGCGARFTQQSARKFHMTNSCPRRNIRKKPVAKTNKTKKKRTRK